MDLEHYSEKYNLEPNSDSKYQFVIVFQDIDHPPATDFGKPPNKLIDRKAGPAFARLVWVNPVDLFNRKARERELSKAKRYAAAYNACAGVFIKVVCSARDPEEATVCRREIPTRATLFNTLRFLDSEEHPWKGELELPAWITRKSAAEKLNPLKWGPKSYSGSKRKLQAPLFYDNGSDSEEA